MQKFKKFQDFERSFDKIDRIIAGTMNKYGLTLLRISMGIVFIWFGVLKPFGLSPAEQLANDLVNTAGWWIPGHEYLYFMIGILEVLIGILFLFKRTLRVAIFLLFVQMPLTMLPLIVLPQVTWTVPLIAPTLEGQYIIKNLVLISAAIVLGGTVRRKELNKLENN